MAAVADTKWSTRAHFHRHVLEGRELRNQSELLINEGKSQVGGDAGARDLRRLAVDDNTAIVRLHYAAENVDEGRLASAISADKSMDLASIDIEAHAAQRPHGAEGLSESSSRDQWMLHVHHSGCGPAAIRLGKRRRVFLKKAGDVFRGHDDPRRVLLAWLAPGANVFDLLDHLLRKPVDVDPDRC